MTSPARILGIDPGTNGGWCLLRPDGSVYLSGHRSTYNRIAHFRQKIVVVCLERVSNWRGDKRGQAIRMEPMIENYGWWQGYCAGLGLHEIHLIHPRTWRTHFGLSGTVTVGKRKVKPCPVQFVNKVFDMDPPLLKKQDGEAVAILLADLGRKFLP